MSEPRKKISLFHDDVNLDIGRMEGAVDGAAETDSEAMDIWSQDELGLTSVPNLLKRKTKHKDLRASPRIGQILQLFWHCMGADRTGELSKARYLDLNVNLHLVMMPSSKDDDTETREAAVEAAEEDWLEDTDEGKLKMTQQLFYDFMFELAEIWTAASNDEEEYAALLWRLLLLNFGTAPVASVCSHLGGLHPETIEKQPPRPFPTHWSDFVQNQYRSVLSDTSAADEERRTDIAAMV